jgi:hypothetical protein
VLTPIPYQKKAFTTIAVNTVAKIIAKTVKAKPHIPVTAFAGDV